MRCSSPTFFVLLVTILAALFSAACSKKQLWYKQGATQADFDRDQQECQIIAHRSAREATIGGRRESLDIFLKAYNNCIFEKGWSTIRPGQRSGAEARHGSRALANFQNGVISVFGQRIKIPDGFRLLRQNSGVLGPTLLHSMFFEGPGPVFMNLVFQESRGRKFDIADYPVESPYFLFDRGVWHGKVETRWAVFCGRVKGEWVVGAGSFSLITRGKRILTIVTAPLPSRTMPPPKGLRLDRKQKAAVDEFEARWREIIQPVRLAFGQ